MPAGSLLAIARHAKSRAPIELISEAEISPNSGVEGDYKGTAAGSQVVVVTQEGWNDACRQLGKEVPWTARRGNLLVSGLDLFETTGARLNVGTCVLEVTEECAPCHVMDAQMPGLRKALTPRWRAGVSCIVVQSGIVCVGDSVELLRPLATATT